MFGLEEWIPLAAKALSPFLVLLFLLCFVLLRRNEQVVFHSLPCSTCQQRIIYNFRVGGFHRAKILYVKDCNLWFVWCGKDRRVKWFSLNTQLRLEWNSKHSCPISATLDPPWQAWHMQSVVTVQKRDLNSWNETVECTWANIPVLLFHRSNKLSVR